MSIFKETISFVDNLYVGESFTTYQLELYIEDRCEFNPFNTTHYNTLYRYLEYLLNAGFIYFNNLQYHKKEEIPFSFSLTIDKLKKLSTDKQYKLLYVRKCKLLKLKYNTIYQQHTKNFQNN